jgi:hypothetical protein
MAGDRDDFLRRWSRRKRETGVQTPAAAPAVAAAPAPGKLPDLESLTFESDFREFMHAKVEESVKRAALKKLFADPRFNVIDQMDIYIDDYTNLETIPQEMLEKLQHARATLFGPQDPPAPQAEGPDATGQKAEATPAQAPAQAAAKKADDGDSG